MCLQAIFYLIKRVNIVYLNFFVFKIRKSKFDKNYEIVKFQ